MYAYADPALSTILETGETSIPRKNLSSTGALVSGNLYLTYFTAQKTEQINNLSIIVPVAGSGTTYCAMGVFDLMRTRNSFQNYPLFFGDPKLSYWTTSDTTIGSAAQRYTKALNATWYKEKGMRYALGLLWTGTTGFAPVGEAQLNSTVTGLFMTSQPILCHVVTGATQLWPSPLLGGSRLASTSRTLSNITYNTATSTALTLNLTQGQFSNAQWGFLPDEVGLPITGTNIPANTVISAWNSFTSVTLSQATTATASNIAGSTLVVGPANLSVTTTPRRIYFEMTT